VNGWIKVVIDPMAISPQITKFTSPEQPITKQPTAAQNSISVENLVTTSGTVTMPQNFLGPLSQYYVWLYGTSINAGVIIGKMSAQVYGCTGTC
jgi:hypothetical protein